ncbi:DUF3164 family protein [Ferrovibrio sp.]|uniref:DUF3164 family protein n=1 Tax=Ferrovibrio sp. TaxID=1917215 RepID=UPI0025C1604A|nr:DUF3164 family protein [Ferrovibrio sp.]MBX3455803.1 DUF3164 family protein [Ferrovibrio sp.]
MSHDQPAQPEAATGWDSSQFKMDSKGRLVPINAIRATDLLEDQLVGKLFSYAGPLHARIGRFKGHCFDDITAFMDLLAEQYGARKGGAKGNITLLSFDGCLKVQVAVADHLAFGPELQIAKQLVDECISRWAEGANDAIRALVNHAFAVDKEGRINSAALFQLRRVNIEDDAWQRAMQALSESIRSIGSKQYIRFYSRPNHQAEWHAVTLDLASAELPPPEPQAAQTQPAA